MQIAKNKVVSIDYTLKDGDGTVIDTSDGREPLQYLHGVGQIVPGLEQALEGQTTGDSVQVVVQPTEGYGEVQDQLRSQVPREHFAQMGDLELGMQFQVPTDQGNHLVVTIVDMNDEVVTVDGNHPLAGVTLHFDVDVRNVRDASEKEIDAGFVDDETSE